VSANEAKTTLLAAPRRRWYRSWWFGVTVSALVLLAAALVYLHLSRSPAPPEVDVAGVDPAIVAALSQAREAVLESPRSAEAWGRLGMVLVVHDYRPQANVCFDQAERLDPRDVRWPYFHALGSLAVTDDEAALPKLEQAVALCGDDFDGPRMRLAELLLRLNRVDEAETHFRHLLDIDPGHVRAQLGLARIAAKRGNHQAALRSLDLAQKDRRTQKAAYKLLAELQQRLGSEAAAEAATRRAAELPDDLSWPDPLRDEVAVVRLGKLALLLQARKLRLEDRGAEAILVLRQAVRDYPNADDAWHQLGQAYLRAKDPQSAEPAFRRAGELAPRSHEHVFYRGAALAAMEDIPAATACFRKAIQLDPTFAPAHHNLGNCLMQAKDPEGAIAAYRTAVRYGPDLFDARLALATLLADRGRPAEALVHARQASQLKPTNRAAQQLVQRLQKALAAPGSSG
jgi:tetratricopeptide (TPR) repeat protein